MSEKIFVPPLKIQGIKTKLVPLIRENVILDKETIWYEPFMGSGVVGFNVEPERAVFADVNPHIINFYNRIKDGSITSGRVRAFLEAEGKKLENGDADYYYEVRDRFNQHHEPLDFLFLNRACFNGMMRFNKDYNFNVPYGHKPQRFAKAYITKIVNQVAHIEELLKNHEWEFLCQSFEDTKVQRPIPISYTATLRILAVMSITMTVGMKNSKLLCTAHSLNHSPILCCQHGITMITVQTNISSRCGMTAKSSHGNIFIM